jgi:hypothetical protein
MHLKFWCLEETRNAHKILVVQLKGEKRPLEELGMGGRVIKCILEKKSGKM